MTTLRNVIGSLDLEQTLTGRDQINAQLQAQAAVLKAQGEARVSPPPSTGGHLPAD